LAEPLKQLLEAVAHGKGTVVLGELGRSRHGDVGGVIKQFSDAVTKLREGDEKLSYADAVDQVSRKNPQLAEEYRVATMAGEGD